MDTNNDTFFSIAGETFTTYREKASKFIGISIPVETETEVREALERIRKKYHDANHRCYAYRLGFEQQLYRISDDGEPSGSAGRPIYGQILSAGLSDILVVVIRYFGGTKLGIPGLINAYRTTARESISSSSIIEKTVSLQFIVTFDYQIINDVMRILKEENCKILQQQSDQHYRIEFSVRRSSCPRIEDRFQRLKNMSHFKIDLKRSDRDPGKPDYVTLI